MDKNNNSQFTFELKDLSYDELIECYINICDFLDYIDDLREKAKEDKLGGKNES